jgi:DNA-binding response OmpR family regulator
MEELQPNLLITDDDRDFRESLGELLTRRGFQTVLADSGEEAIEILQQQSVHLVVVDMHMPRWSGLDTLACLRQMALEVPCILMSAKLDDNIVSRAKELRAESVLAKPFSSQVITQTIRDILQVRYGW